ncbi:hypothetical protein Bca52824_089428 [Brassica carinata]|uniref:Uncharacterized protein n=1 Tax=Brassica carinata TaxID=52824 RepID=A0A8X7PEJ8_BRACI|nr:hypothetical protein Bca52824_089428 [Brassica carinata]
MRPRSRVKEEECFWPPTASSKGNIDTYEKLRGSVQASLLLLGRNRRQLLDKLGKIETEVTQLRTASERTEQFETACNLHTGKIEAEVTKLGQL